MKLITHNLTKKYHDKIAVDNLNIEVPTHSLVAFLGHNGAGKSTTISMLTGIMQPSSGEIKFISPNNKKPKIGVVFQRSVLDDALTVKENLISRAKMQGNVTLNDVAYLIKELGLSAFENMQYGLLSGGQKRRADIARALLIKPDFLFLDEPTTGLDIQTRFAIWNFLDNLRQKNNLTIFLTTHYLEEAENANMVYVIDQGKIIAQGPAKTIINENTKDYLEIDYNPEDNFMDSINRKYEQVTEQKIRITDISVLAAIDFLQENKNKIEHFEYHRGTLNDAFMNLTGKAMK
ncbi:ABC transporter ATP-binding protein [Ligilactobacillus sp. WILCCON 0076]|uniref:ABC transporter ATP-binding protein n=1 Tax=Ligilactobacillus ubinensis TaxID=2876789 RepID=A0A9X2JKD0_9LACO|nr:ABC transporter ATP-binding protein [Ligilactobacillus ubinensis]MCP0886108.1 ABC transporter ATP-binding protein [Ligilactobacillus ubinensis]